MKIFIYFDLDPDVLKEPSYDLRTSFQECISISGEWSKCSIDHYNPLNCPCPYENYHFDKKVMICVEGKEQRTEFDAFEDGIDKFWSTLKSTPEVLDEFDAKYKRPKKNKCRGDSGSKYKWLGNKNFDSFKLYYDDPS